MFSRWRHWILLGLFFTVSACSSLTRNPVPIDRMDQAEVPGLPNVRTYWESGETDPDFQADLIQSIVDEPPGKFPRDPQGRPAYSGLAISGGGSSGAFGAGVLYGWTQSGQRPEFKLVTGISTGALIAPYAFLGPGYDEKLKRAYTTISTRDVVRTSKRPPWSSEALQDSAPLAELIARDVNNEMLAHIAAAHANGQRLYIGTVNLDAQQFVVWNMGIIASSNHPRSLELFRKVMLASASIPGAFPPVYVEVELDGETYDEMHVDGGTITQVFFSELVVDLYAASAGAGFDNGEGTSSTVYVIRNGYTDPQPRQVPREVLTISGRALSTMIKSASINDLMRIQQFIQQDGIDFRCTFIPEDFEFEKKEQFDPEEMQALFELGRTMVVEGTAWNRSPLDR